MTATQAGSDDGSDYEHWQDDETCLTQSAASAAPGYDSHNGLRSHTYHAPPSSSPKTLPTQPQVIYCQQPAQMVAYQPMQYTYAAPVAYPGQAYYAYPIQQAPVQQQPAPQQMANYHVYQPAYSAPVPQQQAQIKGNPWLGRTKAQVEEDNMKIAMREGATDKRKVAPVDAKDDQMMWCVETDGSHTLR